jgi:type I restriction enzyme M protein
MARKASSKPESSNSTATLGFDTDSHSFGNRHSVFVISSAWVQHFIHHLANGSMSSNQSGEGDLRRALPGQLFYSTQIHVCLWFIAKGKKSTHGLQPVKGSGDGLKPRTTLRDRRRETLFIDARKMGTRVHRELTAADLEKIVSTYHAWHSDSSHVVHASACSSPPADTLKREQRAYQDLPGFCKSASTAEIAGHGHVLTPGRYVGAEEVEDEGDPLEEKMPRLIAELQAQFAESAKLEQAIKANLRGLGYGG